MKKQNLITALLALTSISSAFAGNTPIASETNATAARFSRLSQKLSLMNDQQLEKRLTVLNAKGEEALATEASKKEFGLWATFDSKLNGVEGTSTEKVYQTFKVLPNQNEVIVAVIDSGVDIRHEDLKGKIWVNPGEIPGNGIDDDGDGYIDDVNGWNFLGNKNGENINSTTLEITREYARMKKKAALGALSADDQAYLEKTAAMYKAGLGNTQEQYDTFQQTILAFKLLKENGLKEETVAAVTALQSSDAAVIEAKKLALVMLAKAVNTQAATDRAAALKPQLDYYYNLDFTSSTLVGDRPERLTERGYGNNDVQGPDARHGTHVAGIIAASRNLFGIDGQARNVKIMSLRAVPDGDERDKDVANAIRFAADHGARIINMSFGKPLSPQKSYVDAAMKYAEAKGILIVHAAGNDGKNTETGDNNYPNKITTDSGEIGTWIEVGASSKKKDAELPAYFSNWGKTSVDLFAPGTTIVSTVPNNKYASLQGTSMASPEVAGVAALMLNLFPNTSGPELKEVLMQTTTKYKGLQVSRPGTYGGLMVPFESLSKTGGVVNAYRAAAYLSTQNLR